MTTQSIAIPPALARAIWLRAQGLDVASPFGAGSQAVQRATEHLGYVQIDTINVIQRSHHHILFTRIPAYAATDLEHAQSIDKSVFEYWTHALAYTPVRDYRFFVPAMDDFRARPRGSFAGVANADYAALLKRIRTEGPLSIRDFNDDVLVPKTHPWGSRKPSRRALSFGFFVGDLTVSRRTGMVKTYDLSARHFGWRRRPGGATEAQIAQYLCRRALRSQGLISLNSVCHGNLKWKTPVAQWIETQVKRKSLLRVHLEAHPGVGHWIEPGGLEIARNPASDELVHILSPFDPLVIQRERLRLMFGYEHRFEAYVPSPKRKFGYFALPVLIGDAIVAAIDLKMDRTAGKLLVQKWTWVAEATAESKASIDRGLHEFERFQKR